MTNSKKSLISLGFLPFLLCGCTPKDKNKTEPESDMKPEPQNRDDINPEDWGDEMNDFLPNVGETKLLFRHSKAETVGDDGEDYFYNYC